MGRAMASTARLQLLSVVGLLLLLQVWRCHGLESKPTSLCAELVSPKGYPCTEITVETADGFLLGLQNIPYGVAAPRDSTTTTGPAVLLLHGLSAGGDNFVLNDPFESLAFILADAGFDVYIGNNRNTQWSHGSSKYTPLDKAYWDWTLDELAAYDLPAFVDHIYSRRGGSKLFYVAHSQGTLTLLAGLTEGGPAAKQMKDKLRGVVLMAPTAYVTNLDAPIIALTFDLYADLILPLVGIGPADYNLILNILCKASIPACTAAFFGFQGGNNYLNDTRRPTYLKYLPQPTSSFNINHFGQLKRSASFRKYDRGAMENQRRYGQKEPPVYDLAKFPSESFPLLIISGGMDHVSDPQDIQRLLRELSTVNREVVMLPDYGHVDFVLGQRSYLDVYPKVVSFLRRH